MAVIITAVAVVTVIGIICAVMLSVASKVMAVKVDERIPLVRECLPGANCGGCGFPGCDGYAAALVNDEDTALTLCAPGGAAAASKIAAALGREAGEMVQKFAYVNCLGDCDATGDKMQYVGIDTCVAAKSLFGGRGKCTFGCLGLGDCTRTCPSDAIHVGAKGIARVDTRVCTGCGACARVCPNQIISILPADIKARISCSSHDKGPAVKAKCSAGCIGCSLCSKKCPEGAIVMDNNLPVVDYEKCTGCGTCAGVCPAKCILPRPVAKSESA